mgnify:CR=1 FL=1
MHNYLITSTPEKAEALQDSCLHMDDSAAKCCSKKDTGGMEQWAKDFKMVEVQSLSCDWYHSTWQFLRLINMVAVPDWYPFYVGAIKQVLVHNPNSKIFISACADYGMLAKLHEAIEEYNNEHETNCNPQITIADICITPLQNAKWYAANAYLKIDSFVCDNIITGNFPEGEYDLIITDEFLSVIKDELKQEVVDKWKKLLSSGGCVITTAMQGEPTNSEKRAFFAQKARARIKANPQLFPFSFDKDAFENIMKKTDRFAELHTRHMIKNKEQLVDLFRNFAHLQLDLVETPGECVNPTFSYQIIAKVNK